MVKVNLAITYRCNVKKADRDKVNESSYECCFDKLRENDVEIISKFYETDKQGRFHVHMLANADIKIKYSNLKVDGYSSKCLRIWSLAGWNDYIRKDQKYAEATIQQLKDQLKESQLVSEKPHGQEDECLSTQRCLTPRTPKEHQIIVPKKKLF